MNPPYQTPQYNGHHHHHHWRGTSGGYYQHQEEEEQRRHATARLPAGPGGVVPLPPPLPPLPRNKNNFNLGNILQKTKTRNDPHHYQGVVVANRNNGGVGRVVQHRPSPYQLPYRGGGGGTTGPKHRILPRRRRQQQQNKKRFSSPYNEYARKTAYALQRPAYVPFPPSYCCDRGSSPWYGSSTATHHPNNNNNNGGGDGDDQHRVVVVARSPYSPLDYKFQSPRYAERTTTMVHNYYFCCCSTSTGSSDFPPPTTSNAANNATVVRHINNKAATIASLRRQLQITLMRADLHETIALAHVSYDPDYPYFPDDVRNGDDYDDRDDEDNGGY